MLVDLVVDFVSFVIIVEIIYQWDVDFIVIEWGWVLDRL